MPPGTLTLGMPKLNELAARGGKHQGGQVYWALIDLDSIVEDAMDTRFTSVQ